MDRMSDMDQDTRRGEELDPVLALAARGLRASPPTALPTDFAARVVQRAGAQIERPTGRQLDGLLRGVGQWLADRFRPQTQRVRPALQWAWVAVFSVATAVLTSHWNGDDAEVVMVRFSMIAPMARSVSVAGDFNDWDAGRINLQDARGDGRWQALVPMEPGVYQYMFLIDGKLWVADPQAVERLDDGFGQQNSLMRIVADDFL